MENEMPEETEMSRSQAIQDEIDSRFLDAVNQANILLEWAVSVGKKLHRDLVERINRGQEFLAAGDKPSRR